MLQFHMQNENGRFKVVAVHNARVLPKASYYPAELDELRKTSPGVVRLIHLQLKTTIQDTIRAYLDAEEAKELENRIIHGKPNPKYQI